jgi:hypothetical protein
LEHGVRLRSSSSRPPVLLAVFLRAREPHFVFSANACF